MAKRKSTIYHDLMTAALALNVGEQASGILCPFCKGGTKKEKSMSLKREKYQATFLCHRAGCERRGRVQVVAKEVKGTNQSQEVRKLPSAPLMKYKEELVALPPEIEEKLREDYLMDKLDMARLGPMWTESFKRVWLPIYSAYRGELGGVFRSLDGVLPKAISLLTNPDEPSASFYKNYTTEWRQIVLVEDQISAVRAANIVSGVALLGTNLSLSLVRRLASLNPEHVVICLDGDAFDKAIALHDKYSGMFKRCTVAKPPKDIKNMSRDAAAKFLNEAFA